MRKILMVVAVLLVIPGTAYAGAFGSSSLCPGFAEGTVISMRDSCFAGTAQFAPAGVTLTVTNDGELPHTFTAVDGSFDSGILQPGQSFELAIDEPRLVRVFCTLHGTAQGDGMAGVMVIGEPTPETVESQNDETAQPAAIALTLQNDSGSEQAWVPVTSGVVAGLALTALLIASLRRYFRKARTVE